MKASVFGLGYVGCMSAASQAADDHTAIDVNAGKIGADYRGICP